jgi:small subunit ribosomal protein S9
MSKTKKDNFVYAAGKRKNAAARVRLFKGTGETQVNGRPIAEYFPGEIFKVIWQAPFELTETWGKYYATARIIGGGKNGQVEAFAKGLAKTLVATSGDFKAPLKKAGLLTRDARERQRRMVGTGGKARRAKQSPKR